MTSQTGQQIFTKYILPNISRRKDKQIIKFSQLIEYKINNIFLEKLYTKVVGKLVPDPCIKNQN